VYETGLFWGSFPENTQAYRHEMSTPGRKISKESILVLLWAKADGSHQITPITVGKSQHPRLYEPTTSHKL
jgi:hypothetical protein